MLIIYNPEKNLFVLTILRLAMLINIGVLGFEEKESGFLILAGRIAFVQNGKRLRGF